MDHPCILASLVFLSPMCHLHSLGALSELNTVKPTKTNKKKEIFHFQVQTAYPLIKELCSHFFCSSSFDRYAYSDDGSEEFDRDDTTLTLIKPSPLPSNDVRNAPEARPVQGSNGLSNGDLEEDKTE